MNDTIFFFFYNLAHQSEFFNKVIVFFAVYFIYVVIASALLFLVFHKKWSEFIILCISGGLSWGLAKILKVLIHTSRPFDTFPQVQSLFIENG